MFHKYSFVSGHGFIRAAKSPKNQGFSPGFFVGKTLLTRAQGVSNRLLATAAGIAGDGDLRQQLLIQLL